MYPYFICLVGILVDIFESWLKEWDRKLKQEGRNVLLFLDNFSGHTSIALSQIKIKFLPPNTTAASQVCAFLFFFHLHLNLWTTYYSLWIKESYKI